METCDALYQVMNQDFLKVWLGYIHPSLAFHGQYCSMHYFMHTTTNCVPNDWFSWLISPNAPTPKAEWRAVARDFDLKWQFRTPVWGLRPSGLCSLGERLPPPGWWSLASAWDGGFPASEHREGVQPSTACTGPARPAAGLFCLTCRQCALAGGPHLVLMSCCTYCKYLLQIFGRVRTMYEKRKIDTDCNCFLIRTPSFYPTVFLMCLILTYTRLWPIKLYTFMLLHLLVCATEN